MDSEKKIFQKLLDKVSKYLPVKNGTVEEYIRSLKNRIVQIESATKTNENVASNKQTITKWYNELVTEANYNNEKVDFEVFNSYKDEAKEKLPPEQFSEIEKIFKTEKSVSSVQEIIDKICVPIKIPEGNIDDIDSIIKYCNKVPKSTKITCSNDLIALVFPEPVSPVSGGNKGAVTPKSKEADVTKLPYIAKADGKFFSGIDPNDGTIKFESISVGRKEIYKYKGTP